MISQHLPVLQVVVPLLFAPLCVLLRRHTLVWCVALLVSWCSFFIAILLLQQVLAEGEIVYAMGGWDAPWGIEYRLDILNAFVLLIITGIASVVMSFARESVLKEIAEDRIYLFYTAFLLNLTGLCGVVITGDAFNMFVFIEIASLSSYAMISASQQRQSLLAAYRYLILGTVGATFILIGVGLLYAMTGTLNIADLAVRIKEVESTRTIITAFAFFTVGLCIKFGLFPLHYWLPNAYTYAPSVVSAFLSGTTSKVFIYVLLRFLFTIFGAEYAFDVMLLDRILMVVAILAIISGSLAAIYQDNIKKMLAYSSIAQIGYMILGISLVSVTGLMAGILHLFNHALIKTALFMIVACFFFRFDSVLLKDLKGVGRQMPWTTMAFVIGGLSLIGTPLTVGFISKWYLIVAALEKDWWWLAALILLGSILAVIYIWKVVEVIYFQSSNTDSQSSQFKEAPLSMLIPVWVIILANIYFGVNALLTTGIARQTAVYLLGGP
ncbi:MAG: monovalent cation/H+ antiporter subunit D family protein [Gammaproteobacteria bacterium]